MAEIRLQIPDSVVGMIQQKLGGDKVKVTDIAKDAIALYNWAVSERANGRVVLSSSPTGDDLSRITMPSLDAAAAHAEAQKTSG